MMSAITAIVMVAFGCAVARRFWPSEEDVGPLERAAAAGVVALATWIGTAWMLALAGLLAPPWLIGRTVIVAIVAVVLWFRTRDRNRVSLRLSAIEWSAVAAVFVWIAFVLYRGWLLPPVTHDALSYHLPKAVLYVWAMKFDPLAFLPARIRDLPVSYEVLLADVIGTDGSDIFTEWPSVLHYAIFAIAAGALAERWWGRHRAGGVVVMLATAGVPVVLLHSGAHKNDLLIAAGLAAAMVFAGRWFARSDIRALVLFELAIAIAIGTKPQAGLLAVALLPLLLWPLRRGIRMRHFTLAVVVFAAAVVFLGGLAYLPRPQSADAGGTLAPAPVALSASGYGDWSNLWQGPYVLIAAPFSRTSNALSVPWEPLPWFWQRDEIFFSHLGVLWALSALALPVAIVRFRRDMPGTRAERIGISLAALAAFLAMLPVRFTPHGMYTVSLPRYVLFIVPVVFAWTLAPTIRALAARRPGTERTAILIVLLAYVVNAVDFGVNDRFAPMRHVLRTEHGSRFIPFDATRATSAVDRFAGPREPVAVELADGTWIHPAFGAGLTRPVVFVGPTSDLRRIPPAVCWLVFERAFESAWKAPGFDDFNKRAQFLGRNMPLVTDRLFLQAYHSEQWALVYEQLRRGQAVFYRIECGRAHTDVRGGRSRRIQ